LLRRFPLAYLTIVVAVALARALTGHPTVEGWGLSSDELGRGRVWLIATSALIVNGVVVPQIVALALTIAASLRHMTARYATAVMLVAHVGATLLAYGILLATTGDADGVNGHSNDYGTSAVWLGLLGALVVTALPEARAGDRLAFVFIAAAVGTAIGAVTLFSLMTSTEHGLAFALGAGLATLREVRRCGRRSARSAASTEYAPAEPA
jgi:hypothetical protein